MRNKIIALALLLASPAMAQNQGMFGGYPLATPPLTGAETFPADTELSGGQSPQTERIGVNAMANYAAANTGLMRNLLIGGDAGTNLWQRATTGASVTTTVTYGGPDRWAYWSGTNTAMTLSRTSTAADLPTSGYQYGFKMARTSSQTGVVQVCMAQEIESANVYRLAGQTVELAFHARAGANYSPTSSYLQTYIIYGTGSDEGISKLAYGLNAGGGGSTTWTGQTNAVSGSVAISTTTARYGTVASIPTTATEVAVVICFTPVGTASTNDYVALSGIQLAVNANNSALAGTSFVSTAGQLLAFERRGVTLEAMMQYRYFYRLTEATVYAAAGSQASPLGPCAAVDTTHTNCWLAFPSVMRIAPTMTYTAGFASPTSTSQATLGACSALATAQTVSGAIMTNYGALVNCTATTIPAAGVASFFYASSGSGVISASAEL